MNPIRLAVALVPLVSVAFGAPSPVGTWKGRLHIDVSKLTAEQKQKAAPALDSLSKMRIALTFKALRRLRPDYPLWADFPYEYEFNRRPIDVINGSELLRTWVDDPHASPADLDSLAAADEAAWRAQRQSVLMY